MNTRPRFPSSIKKGRRIVFSIDKRQKFVIAVILLSIGLFIAEFQFNRYGVLFAFLLPVFTSIFLLWAIYADVKNTRSPQVFILPFLYSLAFGLFYFLTPTRLSVRLILAGVYAFGLYSLLLSQNIFIVSTSRTIQLLSGARIVSFVITLVSYFLLTNILYAFHLIIFPVILILGIYTFLLIYHSLWTYTLQKHPQPLRGWVSVLTLCILEVASVVWFWPSNPTVTALFLTGFFYSIVGLSHIWLEKRLFKGILWEYVWVGAIVFFVLLLFTGWGK